MLHILIKKFQKKEIFISFQVVSRSVSAHQRCKIDYYFAQQFHHFVTNYALTATTISFAVHFTRHWPRRVANKNRRSHEPDFARSPDRAPAREHLFTVDAA